MVDHFLKFLIRSFWKQRFYSTLNLLGLVIGLTVSIIIYLYVERELSTDNGLAKNPNTYRLLRKGDINSSPYLIGITSGPFAEALLVDFPHDVDKTMRLMPNAAWVKYQDNIFYEKNFALADSNFFDVFNLKLEKGNEAQALAHPNNVIITKEIAQKYFGNEDPINKVIHVDENFDLIVTGVLANQESPSHINPNFIGNISLIANQSWFSQWWNNSMITYVVLKEGSDYKNLNTQFPQFMNKYFGEDFAANKNRIDILLQPIEDVYFENNVRYDPTPHGNINTVFIFSSIGVFILVIALINFINLATAKSSSRAREVGIKKTLGATKVQLIVQFLAESSFFTVIALAISLMIVEVLLPVYNSMYGLNLTFNLTTDMVIKLMILFSSISLLSGLYPAFVLSSFQSIHVLKGATQSGPGAVRFRKILVAVQFTISTFLIVGTYLVGNQLKYINSKSLGFDKEAVILIESTSNEFHNNRETFENLLKANSSVTHVCTMSGEPGGFHDTMSLLVEGMDTNPRMRTNFVDEDFVNTLGLTMIAGRNFSKEHRTDLSQALIVNETAVAELGLTPEEALGKRMMIQMMDTTMKSIIGVVQDFHFSSLRTPIEPLVLSMSEDGGQLGVKINSNDLQSTIKTIEESWHKVVPQYPFQFQFLDDKLSQQYDNEKLQGSLFNFFSIISIIVASLGVIGLATYSASRRQKEIGVRKIMGASVPSLTFLLMKDFIYLVSISALFAWPFAYWSVNSWLSGFAYRISPGILPFILATLFTVLVAILSVIYQSFKVATVNPSEVLKED